MALIGSSTTASSAQTGELTQALLNSLINSTLAAQRKPITSLNSKKNDLTVQKAVYSDLKTKLKNLRSIVEDLRSNDTDPVFSRKSATSSDISKFTATVTSSAIGGTYSIEIDQLATTHRARSDRQTSSTEALGLSGTFVLNGVSIQVQETDTLANIASAINNAEYDDGKEVSATIVDNNLIIESTSTGLVNAITASDTTGSVLANLGMLDGESFKTTLQSALDASFSVNGVNVSRSSNKDINDVVSGVTLNLLAKTEDSKAITLKVQSDYTSIHAKVSAFVSNLNGTVSYLKTKTQTIASEENKTYSRGALANDSIFSSLRINLVNALRTRVTGGEEGDPEELSDIGITIGNGLSVSLNTSKLDSAVQTNLDGVVELFDGVMAKFETLLEPFTTTSSSTNALDLYSKSVNTKIENIERRVRSMESALVKKEKMLVKQYSSIYIQNIELKSQQYSLFGTTA